MIFFTIFYAIREINNYNLSSIQHVFTNNFELLSNFMTYTYVYSLRAYSQPIQSHVDYNIWTGKSILVGLTFYGNYVFFLQMLT